jgi:hypothetical protein
MFIDLDVTCTRRSLIFDFVEPTSLWNDRGIFLLGKRQTGNDPDIE